MKKIYILTLLICLTCFGTSFAQTLKGHIYDAKTNEPLVGAAVTYKLHGNQGVVSNINGEYEIKLPEGGVASVWVSKTQIAWVKDHLNTLRGAVLVAAVLTAFFCIRCFLRMLTLSMRRKLGKSVLAFLHRLAMPLTKLAEKLMATIGIDLRRRNRLNGRDERSIVMDMDKPKKAKKRLKNELKWGEQPDNAARVRFLFIDYMILRIRQGYFLRRTMTPAEISRDIALEEDERELFAAYQKARYAGNRADGEISGEAVGRMRALNERVRSRRIREEK